MKKIKTYKPLLSELIDSVEDYVDKKKLSKPFYNIEIKSSLKGDNLFHPEPDEFVRLAIKIIEQKGIKERVIIQSFDTRPLQIIHKEYPEIKLAFLVMNLKGVSKNVNALGFTTDIYSPYYKMVKKKTVEKCHQMKIKVIPWTINSRKTVDALLQFKVDGIITDYPDLFK